MSSRPATLVYTHGGGRLGNQVLRFAHWLAWAEAQGGTVEIRNLAFWPYAKYFATWRAHPGCVFPLRPDAWEGVARARALLPGWVRDRLDWRALRRVQALGRRRAGWQAVSLDDAAGEALDLAAPAFAAGVRGHRVTTCAGWRIADWALVARRQDALREYFQPAPGWLGPAREKLARLRARHGYVLGVQIRQGDYRGWHDGRFLFAPTDYARWIRQALALHADRRPAAVVVSDGPVDAALFEGMPVEVRQGTHWFDDWVTLAQCDAVLCPPSTFGATAAWVGGCPLWPVVRRDQELDPIQQISGGIAAAAQHPEFQLAVK